MMGHKWGNLRSWAGPRQPRDLLNSISQITGLLTQSSQGQGYGAWWDWEQSLPPTLGQQIALHSPAKSSHKEGRGWEFLSEAFCYQGMKPGA